MFKKIKFLLILYPTHYGCDFLIFRVLPPERKKIIKHKFLFQTEETPISWIIHDELRSLKNFTFFPHPSLDPNPPPPNVPLDNMQAHLPLSVLKAI